MNKFIILDSLKYMTKSTDWSLVISKPATARLLLSGQIDVSYGPGVYNELRGTIIAPVAAPEGWGTINDLRSTLVKMQGLDFTDHYGTEHTAHVFGELPQQSLSPMWDGSSNEFYVPVRLVLE